MSGFDLTAAEAEQLLADLDALELVERDAEQAGGSVLLCGSVPVVLSFRQDAEVAARLAER